jgi:hypothetical protein
VSVEEAILEKVRAVPPQKREEVLIPVRWSRATFDFPPATRSALELLDAARQAANHKGDVFIIISAF